jgi:hypothetical protein
MATGKIIYIGKDPRGLFGYVRDDAISDARSDLNIYFDSRCIKSNAAIGIGDRVKFQYDIGACKHDKPRMRFDTMEVLEEEKTA